MTKQRQIYALWLKRGLDGRLETKYFKVNDRLQTFYYLLECSTIDIVTRAIAGKPYDIIIDDEALLTGKDKEPPLGICNDASEALFGSLLICGLGDEEGNLTSLHYKDAERIQKSIDEYINTKNGKSFQCLTYSVRP